MPDGIFYRVLMPFMRLFRGCPSVLFIRARHACRAGHGAWPGPQCAWFQPSRAWAMTAAESPENRNDAPQAHWSSSGSSFGGRTHRRRSGRSRCDTHAWCRRRRGYLMPEDRRMGVVRGGAIIVVRLFKGSISSIPRIYYILYAMFYQQKPSDRGRTRLPPPETIDKTQRIIYIIHGCSAADVDCRNGE